MANNKKYLIGVPFTREDLLSLSVDTKVYLRRVDGVRTLRAILKQPFFIVETWLRNKELYHAINKYSDEYRLRDVTGSYEQLRDSTPADERRLRVSPPTSPRLGGTGSYFDAYERFTQSPGGRGDEPAIDELIRPESSTTSDDPSRPIRPGTLQNPTIDREGENSKRTSPSGNSIQSIGESARGDAVPSRRTEDKSEPDNRHVNSLGRRNGSVVTVYSYPGGDPSITGHRSAESASGDDE